MNKDKKQKRYERLLKQIAGLMPKCTDSRARMCTITAILHHKMPDFFWTGFYLLSAKNELIVSNYQGPVACMLLKKNQGVCWAAIKQQKTMVVPNVELFTGHIACDSRSKSEIVIPVNDAKNKIIGVLDIDSDKLNTFDEIDAKNLEEIVKLVFK